MATTYEHYHAIKRLEEDAARIGLKVSPSQFGQYLLCLKPDGDLLPMYARDAEIATGTAESLTAVLRGWEIATNYYTMLKATSGKKIKECEDRYRQDRLARMLKDGTDIRKEDK
jgi:hypothetical protein